MKPVKYDFLVFMQRDFSQAFTFFDDDGDKMDFTGCTFVGKLARGFFDRATPTTINVANTAPGEITLSIPSADVRGITFQVGVFDVSVDFPSPARTETLMFGNVLVFPNVA